MFMGRKHQQGRQRGWRLLWRVLWLVGLWVSALACSTPPTSTPPDAQDHPPQTTEPPESHATRWPRHVGQPCQSDPACPEKLRCETQIPQGYCTRECLRSAHCPGQSVCVRITFGNGARYQRCVHTCRTQDDCRPSFLCYRPSGSSTQICLPPRP